LSFFCIQNSPLQVFEVIITNSFLRLSHVGKKRFTASG